MLIKGSQIEAHTCNSIRIHFKWVQKELTHCLGVCVWKLGVTPFSRAGRSWDHEGAHGDLWADNAHSFLFLFQFH